MDMKYINTVFLERFRNNPIREIGKWAKEKEVYDNQECTVVDMVTLNFSSVTKVTTTVNTNIKMRGYSQPYFHIVTPDGIAVTLDGGIFKVNNPSFLLRFIQPDARPFILELVRAVRSAA